MRGTEFDKAIEMFSEQWPRAMGKVRVGLLWEKHKGLPDDVFAHAINALIYRGGQAPSGEVLDAEIQSKLVKAPEHVAALESLEGCEICRGSGMVEFSDSEKTFPAACDCKLGQSFYDRIPKAWDMHKKGLTPRARMNDKVKTHPDYMEPDELRFGNALCGLFLTIQRAILVKDSVGVEKCLKHFGISKGEAWQAYKDIRAGVLSERLMSLRNRGSLMSLLQGCAKDVPFTQGAAHV